MPRGERPLDARGGPLLDFAARLRKLREEAGSPTYRELARRAHYSIATLSGAAAGRQLPTLAVTLAYVRACGGDEREWELNWRRTAAECAAGTMGAVPDRDGETPSPPYVGLAPFQQSDADTFFGRENLTDKLVEHLKEKRFLVLFGASGSGKSSVLRAGVLPAFPGKPALVLTPGPHPLEECAIQLAARAHITPGSLRAELASEPRTLHRVVRQILARSPNPPDELIVIVDQFEEVFTLCRSARERDAFVASLLHAAQTSDSRCRVALAVRSDFYTHCTRLPDLVDALADAHVPVGPMTTDELRAAIVQPATRAGLTVEGALLAALTADAHGRPGALPLLSHALLETWHRRRGNALTLAAFQAAGGFEGALAQTAEAFHSGLSDTQQHITRLLFLRLIALGEGTEDTKRRVPRHELDDTPDTTLVVDQATRARLLTVDRDHVELTHEALIRCWPRLGRWLGENREQLRLHRGLTEATAVWESLDRDPDTLYRGVRLAAVKDVPKEALSARERAFLDASENAGRRRVRRLRALVILVLCTVAAVGFAVHAQSTVTEQRHRALALQAADASLKLRPHDQSLAVQVALAAYRLAPGTATRDSLLSTLSITSAGRSPVGYALAVSPDGRTVAAAGNNRRIELWDMAVPRRPRRLSVVDWPDDSTHALAFGPRGDTLMALGLQRMFRLWDVSDPRRPALLSQTPTGHDELVYDMAVSQDGHLAATSSYDDTVRLWNVTDPARPRLLSELAGHSLNVKPVAFSPDGRTLASGSDDRTVRLWDVTDPRHPSTIGVLRGHENFVDVLAYSNDGRTLVSASDDRTARLWDVTDPRRHRPLSLLRGHTDVVTGAAFAPGDNAVVTTGEDGRVHEWDVADRSRPTERAFLTNPAGSVKGVRYLSANGMIITASGDQTVHLWTTGLDSALSRACGYVRVTISRAEWADHFPGVDYRPPCAGRKSVSETEGSQ
ncbi:nSTAND1 domain-containing NTPase [Streptomyces spongiae]|uniref:nSTAND1 domain-containing NTPase n=1 Tax=Streptomyces spongiae TaxID=565072 RepID=UPI0018839EDA|nr:helix-turn-helix domain-containing protein [Streptomyces spongiae]